MDALLLGIYDLAQVDETLYLSYATENGGVTDTTDVATTVIEKFSRTWGVLHTQVLVNDPNPNNPSHNRLYPMPSGQDSFTSGTLSEPRQGGYVSADKSTYGPEYTNNLGKVILEEALFLHAIYIHEDILEKEEVMQLCNAKWAMGRS
jgi:hypothetical protein